MRGEEKKASDEVERREKMEDGVRGASIVTTLSQCPNSEMR